VRLGLAGSSSMAKGGAGAQDAGGCEGSNAGGGKGEGMGAHKAGRGGNSCRFRARGAAGPGVAAHTPAAVPAIMTA
jgi:hypothetical protein